MYLSKSFIANFFATIINFVIIFSLGYNWIYCKYFFMNNIYSVLITVAFFVVLLFLLKYILKYKDSYKSYKRCADAREEAEWEIHAIKEKQRNKKRK